MGKKREKTGEKLALCAPSPAILVHDNVVKRSRGNIQIRYFFLDS
jgi:hypothetical protein